MRGRYTRAILAHGIAIPGFLRLLLILVVGGVAYLFEMERTFRIERHAAHEDRRAEIAEVDAYMATRRRDAAAWSQMLAESSVRRVVATATTAAADFPVVDLVTTEMTQVAGDSPMAEGVKTQPHSRLQVGLDGGLGPIQTLAHALEWSMPQLSAEGVAIQRNAKGVLSATLKFMLWRKDAGATEGVQ